MTTTRESSVIGNPVSESSITNREGSEDIDEAGNDSHHDLLLQRTGSEGSGTGSISRDRRP
jgi:hypothetical protein